MVFSSDGMLGCAKVFFLDLFQQRGSSEDLTAVFLDAVAGRLPRNSAKELEGQVSLEKVESTMLSLKTGVAPGGDGLPVERYRTFWSFVGPDLVAVYREELAARLLPPSARVGHVALLHKWLPTEGGAVISRNVMLFGSGLGRMESGMARPLWQAISVAKCILWGTRCECIWSQSPRVCHEHLLRAFKAKFCKVQWREQGGEGFVRVGVGSLKGGGFSESAG